MTSVRSLNPESSRKACPRERRANTNPGPRKEKKEWNAATTPNPQGCWVSYITTRFGHAALGGFDRSQGRRRGKNHQNREKKEKTYPSHRNGARPAASQATPSQTHELRTRRPAIIRDWRCGGGRGRENRPCTKAKGED